MREYVCYAGRLKGGMYLVNGRLVVRIAAKTWQIRGWTSEMLPIACKSKGSGVLPGDPSHSGGRGGTSRTGSYIYILRTTEAAIIIYVGEK